MMSERMKLRANTGGYAQMYFWRTHQQKEVDLIELADGRMTAFEFKWNGKRKAKLLEQFKTSYPDTTFHVVTPDNFTDFV